jgi:hypothetical protein
VVVAKCSKIPVEHAGCIARVTELVQVDAKVRWRDKYIIYVRWIEGVRLIPATAGVKREQDCPKPMGVQHFQQQPFFFSDLTGWRYANNVDIDCGMISARCYAPHRVTGTCWGPV